MSAAQAIAAVNSATGIIYSDFITYSGSSSIADLAMPSAARVASPTLAPAVHPTLQRAAVVVPARRAAKMACVARLSDTGRPHPRSFILR